MTSLKNIIDGTNKSATITDGYVFVSPLQRLAVLFIRAMDLVKLCFYDLRDWFLDKTQNNDGRTERRNDGTAGGQLIGSNLVTNRCKWKENNAPFRLRSFQIGIILQILNNWFIVNIIKIILISSLRLFITDVKTKVQQYYNLQFLYV